MISHYIAGRFLSKREKRDQQSVNPASTAFISLLMQEQLIYICTNGWWVPNDTITWNRGYGSLRTALLSRIGEWSHWWRLTPSGGDITLLLRFITSIYCTLLSSSKTGPSKHLELCPNIVLLIQEWRRNDIHFIDHTYAYGLIQKLKKVCTHIVFPLERLVWWCGNNQPWVFTQHNDILQCH